MDHIKLKITFAESELLVDVDQRDLAAVELTDYMHTSITRMRWLAWSAATRAKSYTAGWEKFKAEAIEVADADTGQVPADPDEPDPTKRGAGAGS